MKQAKINWTIKSIPLNELYEFEKNPRSMSKKMRKKLLNCIEEWGLIDKPVINQDGQIIGGHQRIRLLAEEGETACDCWMPDCLLTESQVEKLALSLNKVSGEWDWDKLANLFDIDVLLESGFEAKDFHDEGKGISERKPKVILEFDNDKDVEAASDLIEQIVTKIQSCKAKFKR